MNIKKINELEKGDLLWVRVGCFICKAKYLGKGIVKYWFIVSRFETLEEFSWWSFRRKSLWGILKKYFITNKNSHS